MWLCVSPQYHDEGKKYVWSVYAQHEKFLELYTIFTHRERERKRERERVAEEEVGGSYHIKSISTLPCVLYTCMYVFNITVQYVRTYMCCLVHTLGDI